MESNGGVLAFSRGIYIPAVIVVTGVVMFSTPRAEHEQGML